MLFLRNLGAVFGVSELSFEAVVVDCSEDVEADQFVEAEGFGC